MEDLLPLPLRGGKWEEDLGAHLDNSTVMARMKQGPENQHKPPTPVLFTKVKLYFSSAASWTGPAPLSLNSYYNQTSLSVNLRLVV